MVYRFWGFGGACSSLSSYEFRGASWRQAVQASSQGWNHGPLVRSLTLAKRDPKYGPLFEIV